MRNIKSVSLKRVKAAFTVEATFVLGIICMVLFLMISRTLEFGSQTEELAQKCTIAAKEKPDILTSMRLERLVGRVFDD